MLEDKNIAPVVILLHGLIVKHFYFTSVLMCCVICFKMIWDAYDLRRLVKCFFKRHSTHSVYLNYRDFFKILNVKDCTSVLGSLSPFKRNKV